MDFASSDFTLTFWEVITLLLLVAVSVFTFVFAAVCTAHCVKGLFDSRPLFMYWFFTCTMIGLAWIFRTAISLGFQIFLSPVFLVLLWHYDKLARKQFNSTQKTTENDSHH